jgi:hypothetical protein
VFTVSVCGFVPRCSLEHDDASQVRLEKIYRLIGSSSFGIHDISRTELDGENHLPRFNMPLELGFFLGAKQFGAGRHRSKRCLILDRDRYRFQKFISDIAGQDIKAHGNSPENGDSHRAGLASQRSRPGEDAGWIASLGEIPEIHKGAARYVQGCTPCAGASHIRRPISIGPGLDGTPSLNLSLDLSSSLIQS